MHLALKAIESPERMYYIRLTKDREATKMAFLLLCVLSITEIIFCAMQIRLAGAARKSSEQGETAGKITKQGWALHRLIANIIELILFLIMVLLPGIDLGFRFKALMLLLGIRIIVGGLVFLIDRRNSKDKKKSGMIMSAVFGILFFTTALIPAFVFADYSGRPVTGSYQVAQGEAILIDHSRTESFESDGSCREVPVHFYYPEGIESMEEHSLPLIIFSHGAFGYYQSNASTYMELASNGYVVVSLDHPYHSFFTKDSNGKLITVNPEFIQSALTIGNDEGELSNQEIYDHTSKWISLRIADMNFVIDTLKNAAAENQFDDAWCFNKESRETISAIIKATDTSKIGLMGHSLGGATAVTVGRRSDIMAVIDLDGTMLGEQTGVKDNMPVINDAPYTTPLLSIDNEEHYLDRTSLESPDYQYANNVVLENASTAFNTYFKGSEHMNFTDLPLFSPFLADKLGTGSIDPAKCIDQVNGLVLEFFNCYIKGVGKFTVKESY